VYSDNVLLLTLYPQYLGEPSRSPFRIDPTTGSVTLTADLMNEAYADISSFTLNVSATDDGSCCELGTVSLEHL